MNVIQPPQREVRAEGVLCDSAEEIFCLLCGCLWREWLCGADLLLVVMSIMKRCSTERLSKIETGDSGHTVCSAPTR